MPAKKQIDIIQSSQNCTDVLTDTFFQQGMIGASFLKHLAEHSD